MEHIFLSIGSNMGDRMANLRHAIGLLREFATVESVSHAYETEPVEYTEQPWFLNAAVAIKPTQNVFPEEEAPQALLEKLLATEREMGRQRGAGAYVPKGPRPIDLDIVLYGDRVISTETLTVPHPAMHLRRFVLEPLAEIAPTAVHPVLHWTVLEMLEALPAGDSAVRKFAPLISLP